MERGWVSSRPRPKCPHLNGVAKDEAQGGGRFVRSAYTGRKEAERISS